LPIPHQTQMRLIRRRLAGKEGSDRLRELRAILSELPNYKNGPYADLRKWVHGQVAETRLRSRVTQRDSIAVRREGSAQVALVGPPNGGKSSLLQALSNVQIKVGDYAFTTVRPVPALTRIGGVLLQLVEIPGLIPGAADDRGGGRALLGVLREADAVLYCQDLGAAPESLCQVRAEVARAGIDLPALLVATKLDEAPRGALDGLRRAVPDLAVVAVSVLDDGSLEALRRAIWDLVDLVRIHLRHQGVVDDAPVALPRGATVADVAAHIHGDLLATFAGARVWGPSARFDGQRVGREHPVCDGDQVEILR
ncbi:MAG: TGS domain-containing protein, partial [Candidatus Dormibacteraeota bacterium]|nr:TGS domain-containing protein [Candidatus Dormibacteraeota bacterium]